MTYTEEAKKIFEFVGLRFPREVIWGMGMAKWAAALANVELCALPEDLGKAIADVALELAEGRYDDRIVVEPFQTGSGTALNMNVNEVIAEEAARRLGRPVHPNDHVNKSQSSNDVVPTAVRLAAARAVHESVIPNYNELVGRLEALGDEHGRVVRAGRTHLRDALPTTLGQAFKAYADMLRRDFAVLKSALQQIYRVPLGGTMVGTGWGAPRGFDRRAVDHLQRATGLPLEPMDNKSPAMRSLTDLVNLTGALRGIALDLVKMGQDLRIMYSGPFTGLDEVKMGQTVPGSSFMPGKENPVAVEAVMLASAQVMGLDAASAMANTLGELELNMGIPLVGYNAVMAAKLVGGAMGKLSRLVLPSVTPNVERMRMYAESSAALIGALKDAVGYDAASRIARRLAEGGTVRDVLREFGYGDEDIRRLVDEMAGVGQDHG